ncbi:YihY/virulence factor BrkB family protein [Niabella yanshanensis]|uniref:YihY/virulence factor BrkB family protein n=1 Tax=Niabella yanshanensis TaxID=577386 RepID=A0ABZ0W8Q0_9BACT|nr:YihY/virulence factor BrkB family protein [Niabella yanshanensis]WQD39576.1 YihY/virulence factor BrkB family protein [Niabella yanshanensis]
MGVGKKIKEKVEDSGVWRQMVARSRSENLPGFRSVSLFNTVKKFKEHVVWDDLIERASAISFNSAMALPPLLLFLCTLIPIIARFTFVIQLDLDEQLYDLIRDVIPASNNNEPIVAFVHGIINEPRNGLLIFSIFLSIFFSSNAMMGVMRSFDKDYTGFTKRKGIRKRLTAIRITLVLVFLFILCLALLIAQQSVLEWLGIENEWLAAALGKVRWVLIILLLFFIISYIYRHAPSVHKKWKILTPGSIIATCLVIVCSLAFSWYVSKFGTYNKLYGSIGTIIVLLALMFLNSLILLIGFEINASIYALAKTREDKEALKD